MGTVPSGMLVRAVWDDEPPEVLVADSVLLDVIHSEEDVWDWEVLESEPPEVDVIDWVGVVVTVPPLGVETVERAMVFAVLLVSIAVEGGGVVDIKVEEVSVCPATNTRGRSSPKKRRCWVPGSRHLQSVIMYLLGT